MPEKIRLVYSKGYAVDIGQHVFSTTKYKLIKKQIMKDPSLKSRVDFVSPKKAREENIPAIIKEFVFRQAKAVSIPAAVVLAGGYAFHESDTVDIYCNTITSGIKLFHG